MVAKIKVDSTEVIKAFNKVDHKIADLSDAHKAEADMLLPSVLSATRRKSGDLVAGWETDGIATEARFSNLVVYAGVQEFGWPDHNIAPTGAIARAFEHNQKETERVYGDAIGRIGESAGFHVK